MSLPLFWIVRAFTDMSAIRSEPMSCDRLEQLLTDLPATHESAGRFLWAPDQLAETIPFRHPATEDDRRSVDEISLAELLGLIQQHPEALTDPDPATTLARHLGISRVAKSTQARLEEVIEAAEVCGPMWKQRGRWGIEAVGRGFAR